MRQRWDHGQIDDDEDDREEKKTVTIHGYPSERIYSSLRTQPKLDLGGWGADNKSKSIALLRRQSCGRWLGIWLEKAETAVKALG